MSDENKPITAEHLFKRIVWRNAIGLGSSTEQFTTWTLAGIAALIGLLISHLESISAIIDRNGLRWSLTILALSFLAGVISKWIGMSLTHGVKNANEMDQLINSKDGQDLMRHLNTPPKELVIDIASAFWWPLSWYIRRKSVLALRDYSLADKGFVSLFCAQIYINFFHVLLGAASIMIMAMSLK